MLLAVLAVLFFLSGACALVYQLLWLRLLGLVFGVTVYAASTVLASFMAGLAIGSYAGGRLAGRVARPLLWFAAAEALIAVSAASTPIVLGLLQNLYPAVYHQLSGSLGALTGVRLLMSFLVLIVPTALMGATLPLVMRSSLLRSANLASRFGLLYSANTAGAILGCLAAGLLLIPYLGIRRTFVVAAAANLAVASGAALLGMRGRTGPGVETRPSASSDPAAAPPGAGDRRAIAVLVTFVVSGWASLALEVLWFRVDVLLIRPTVYAFAMMLATVLAGIALGSAAAAPLLARHGSLMALAVLEFLIAASALLSFQGLRVATATTAWVNSLGLPVAEYLIPLIVTSLLTIFPTMFLMGAAFPLGVRLWTGYAEGDAREGVRRLGVFYALNVCGAIVGALTAGFVLLPLAGSRATLYTIGTLVAASAVGLLAVDRGGVRRLVLGVAGLAALAALPVPDPFEMVLRQRFPHDEFLWREEGVQTTVSVHRAGPLRTMYLDGVHQASTGSLVHGHRRIGHLGMALHPDPREVFVIGLGGGATAGAVSQHSYAQVDVVELSRSVVEAARLFSEVNYNLLERPNVRVLVDDGRNRLMLGDRKYDVIMADVIQPIHAGATNVYSAEYFTLVRSALQEDGLAVQWVFGTDAEFKMIMRTFQSVFPHTTIWNDASVMVGSQRPLQLGRSDFEWKLHVPEARIALEAAGYGTWDALIRSYTAGSDEMRRFAGPGPILTDDLPAIEYFLSLPREPVRTEWLRGDVRTILRKD